MEIPNFLKIYLKGQKTDPLKQWIKVIALLYESDKWSLSYLKTSDIKAFSAVEVCGVFMPKSKAVTKKVVDAVDYKGI